MSRNHRGKRSVLGKAKRTQKDVFRSLTYEYSFNDKKIREDVCIDTTDFLVWMMMWEFQHDPQIYFHHDEMQGIVIHDQLETAYWENSLPPVPLQLNEVKSGLEK